MTISMDFIDYLEHKPFFDEMAKGLQAQGHKVGFICSLREKEYSLKNQLIDNRKRIMEGSGFTPDFVRLWGENESIANGDLWKCERMDEEDVCVHFDDDAAGMKKYTDRWVMKVLNSGQPGKF